jgi:3-mercaptopropionate dioxygenase
MSLTSAIRREADPAARTGICPSPLASAIRGEVSRGLGWQATADRVAGVLRTSLPVPSVILPPELRRGDPSGYQSHLLYAAPDGTFSVSAMVWLPGQQTPVHDHVAWCVTAVLQGGEHEEIFALDRGGQALRCIARNVNSPGSVSAFAPPGDIHRVRNTGSIVAISLHVYGADISRLGTSIRREYTLPLLP